LMQFWWKTYDWNLEFDSVLTKQIVERDFGSILQKKWVENIFQLAHPSHDHYLPLLYFLWTVEKQDWIEIFNDTFEYGSLSMKSFIST
jgi:4,5-DOPA dioxygenase extradiol